MKKVYIVQFELTEAFSSARKAARCLKNYYGSFDWTIQAYDDVLDGKDLKDVTDEELFRLLQRKDWFELQSGRDSVRIRKVEVQ